MGKVRYNAKARQVVKTNVDNTQTSEVHLEFPNTEYGSSGASNMLVLPSRRRTTKVIIENEETTRFLSQSQRKRLQKILEKKKKKANRAALLESLSQVQATPDEVKQLTSISDMQTIGRRKLKAMNSRLAKQEVQTTATDSTATNSMATNIMATKSNATNSSTKSIIINSVPGACKKRLLKPVYPEPKEIKHDPNICVIGLDPSSSYSSDSDDTDDAPEIVNGNDNSKETQSIENKVQNNEATNEISTKVHLEFPNTEYGSSGDSNMLVLPSRKGTTEVFIENEETTRILSKFQIKNLQKKLAKKKKKATQAALLESQVQATPDEVKQLTSISDMQTIGRQKLKAMNSRLAKQEVQTTATDSGTKHGACKKRLLKQVYPEPIKKIKHDPNICEIGLEPSSSDSSDSDDTDDAPEIVNGNDNLKETRSVEIKAQNNETTNEIATKVQNNDIKTKVQNNEDSKKTAAKESVTPHIVVDITETCNKKNKNADKRASESVVEVKEEMPPLEHPTNHVNVNRDPKIQVARLKLPILGEEQRIMELINENEFVIIAGETGSGKTTQIPQFLYEAGYAEHKMIAVTEPRRVAAMAMSARVAHELGLTSKEVSYHIRFEGNATKDTKIKFMTDGVLLKEILADFYLSKYSVVILDEAHERSIYTDILIGMLARIVPMRRKSGVPLRLIIMSATLRVSDFIQNRKLFKVPPPVVKIESRQFPVTVHFNKHTNSDYIKEAYNKTVKIHTRLPNGGILIFVTGQGEVRELTRKLKAAFPYRKNVHQSKLIMNNNAKNVDLALDSEPDDIESDDDEVQKEMKRALKAHRKGKQKWNTRPKINLDDYDYLEDDEQTDLADDDNSEGYLSDSDVEDYSLTASIKSCRQPLWVLPLYSVLSSSMQARVFEPPPVGCRLCVVSTDVAETSLTIPSIRYVVDTGKKKLKVYDPKTGVTSYKVVWTSQASAEQRSGRAGRVSAGHAYRLYSSAVFQHDCPEQLPPDLIRRPLYDIVLTMKNIGIDKVINFPFPTPPDMVQLKCAEKTLEILGLLTKHELRSIEGEEVLKLTPLGKHVTLFPVSPRFGKILVSSVSYNLTEYAINLVSALSVSEVMSGKPDSWPAKDNMLLLGDMGVLLRAVGASENAYFKGEGELFCAKYGLREKAIIEIRKLRKQLISIINLSPLKVNITFDPELQYPDDNQTMRLRQLVLSGFGDQVARKIDLEEVKQGQSKGKFKYAYHCGKLEEPVYLHADSILRQKIPDWVVYQDLEEKGVEGRKKMVMINVTAIEPEWLPKFVPQLCNLDEPLLDPPPRYDQRSDKVKCHCKGTFGKAGWELPIMEIDFPENIERYKWFGRFFLEGAVFPKLKKYIKDLLAPPSTMVKSWAKLHYRTEMLLKVLVAKRIGSRDALKAIWKDHEKFLLPEYLHWTHVSSHNEIALYWPPL